MAESIPLERASKDSIPLPANRSRDDLHKLISMTLKSVSRIYAFDGRRLGLSSMSISLDLYSPEIILTYYSIVLPTVNTEILSKSIERFNAALILSLLTFFNNFS